MSLGVCDTGAEQRAKSSTSLLKNAGGNITRYYRSMAESYKLFPGYSLRTIKNQSNTKYDTS